MSNPAFKPVNLTISDPITLALFWHVANLAPDVVQGQYHTTIIRKPVGTPEVLALAKKFNFSCGSNIWNQLNEGVLNNKVDVIDGSVAEAPIVVRLSGMRDAQVSKDGITVGCQTFPLSVVKELQAARDTVLQKS